jgi:hypothetical protein
MSQTPQRRTVTSSRHRTRLLLLFALTVVTVAAVFFVRPIAQDPAYHNFADQRTLVGIPHALNTLSNIPFLLAGALGFIQVLRGAAAPFSTKQERWPYYIFFFGVAMTCFGSSYYHLAPGNERLVWDRLPMSVAFMSLFAAVIIERISRKAGLILLVPLVAVGVASVIYWNITEQTGRGDLRPYVVVQFYTMLAVAMIVLLFPSRYTRGYDVLVAVAIYGVAKVAEALDGTLLAANGVISGHSAKHIVAALSASWIIVMLKRRQPAG